MASHQQRALLVSLVFCLICGTQVGSALSRSSLKRQPHVSSPDQTLSDRISKLPTVHRSSKTKQSKRWKDLSFFEKTTFSWTRPTLQIGKSRQVQATDLSLIDTEDSEKLSTAFYHYLNTQFKNETITIQKIGSALFFLNKKTIIVNGLLRLFNTGTQLMPSILVTKILKLLESTSNEVLPVGVLEEMHLKTFSLSCLLCAVLVLKGCIESTYFYRCYLFGLKVKMALAGSVFEKSTHKVGHGGSTNQTAGEVVNLIQVDTERVGEFAGYMHTLWDGLLQIFCYCFLLHRLLGSSAFVGMFLLSLLLPLNAVCFVKLARLKRDIFSLMDQRLKLVNEVLSGIRLIKMQALESHFMKRLLSYRALELAIAKNSSMTRTLLHLLLSIAPTILFGFTIFTYVLVGNTLSPSKVFGSLALFNQLRYPLLMYPIILSQLADAKVALARISLFLSQSELSTRLPSELIADSQYPFRNMTNGTVILKSGDYYWLSSNSNSETGTNSLVKKKTITQDKVKTKSQLSSPLSTASEQTENGLVKDKQVQSNSQQDVNGTMPLHKQQALHLDRDIIIHPGELICVVGKMGSGKSAFLLSLLNELHYEKPLIHTSSHTSTEDATDLNTVPTEEDRGFVIPNEAEGGLIRGSVGYCSQAVWLPSGHLKDAVMFHRKGAIRNVSCLSNDQCSNEVVYEKDRHDHKEEADELTEWYLRVIEACQLSQDVASFPAQHMAPVGERGVSMSGGQRQRISIARGVYGKPDVLILDDSLSALDPTVAQRLFQSLLSRHPQSLLANTTIIFATNQLKWLKHATKVLVIDKDTSPASKAQSALDKEHALRSGETTSTSHQNCVDDGSVGRVVGFGTLSELQEKGIQFDKLEESLKHNDTATSDDKVEVDHTDSTKPISTVPQPSLPTERNEVEQSVKSIIKDSEVSSLKHNSNNEKHKQPYIPKQDGEKESTMVKSFDSQSTGAVQLKVYHAFLASVKSSKVLMMFVLSALLGQAASVGQQIFLSKWSEDGSHVKHSLGGYILRLSMLTSFATFFQTMKSLASIDIQLRSGSEIHKHLSSTILRAPLSLFDVTPMGMILQRFSKDMEIIDRSLYHNLGLVINAILTIVGSFTTLVYASPLFVLTIWPLAFCYIHYLSFYRPGARELKRLEASLRSPVISHFSECLTGATTLRAFGEKHVEHAKRQAFTYIDESMRASMVQKGVDRWLSIRLEVLGNAVVFLATMLATKKAFGAFIPQYLTQYSLIAMSALCYFVLEVSHTAEAVLSRTIQSNTFLDNSAIVTGLAKKLSYMRQLILAQDENKVFAPILKGIKGLIAFLLTMMKYCLGNGLKLWDVVSSKTGIARGGKTTNQMTGLTGLAIINSMSTTGMLNWAVRTFTMVENDMISMERILNVLDNTPQENYLMSASNTVSSPLLEPEKRLKYYDWWKNTDVFEQKASGNKSYSNDQLVKPTSVLSPDWPPRGEIEFKHVTASHGEGSIPALKEVSFTFESGQRVGVVGRSGSGKSTLLSSLLNLISVSSGDIYIDGVNIKDIPLHILRKQVGILAQEPTLFEGTVRSNLDPEGIHTDSELWTALKKCQISDMVESLGLLQQQRKKHTDNQAPLAHHDDTSGVKNHGTSSSSVNREQVLEMRSSDIDSSEIGKGTQAKVGLDAVVSEFGSNLSSGQGQLLCLARVMLRKPKIILLDEATASVDTSTDLLIQHALRVEFKNYTTIVVAHRLSNVLDCDQILVMDRGMVAESGTPSELSRKPSSKFAKMIKQEATERS